MQAVVLLLAMLALAGHLAIWTGWINRLHSTATPRSLLRLHDVFWCLIVVGAPLSVGWSYVRAARSAASWLPLLPWPVLLYLAVCWLACLLFVPTWLWRRRRDGQMLLSGNHTHVVDVARQLEGSATGDMATALAARVPGNEILRLSVHQKVVALARLPRELSGLSLVHLSDLHVTGQLSRGFYEEVVRQANRLEGDLIVVTGDIVDRQRLLDWLPATVGRLRAPHGVYFVLGNHDTRTGAVETIRSTLTQCGLVDLGGRWRAVEISGQTVVLAGNELPWLPPAADMEHCPELIEGRRPLRILLSHSPDQFAWARSFDFDLMLAGHCHGGQFRLPGIGPILSPSRHGVRYAAGTFFEDPTLMHVSRGIAGTRPFRFNCPPELSRLTLECGPVEA